MSREAGATKKAAVEAAPAKKAEPKSIKKRNGETVPFDAAKIQEAIRKACVAVPEEKISKKKLEELTAAVVAAIPGRRTPTVEQVQDLVEETLIREGFARTAKAYILYRAEHAKIRQSEGDLMEIYKELTFAYAKDADIKRENANIDADTAMGTMLKYGSEGSKYFIDNYILPKDVAAAHINGDIHIHDKDFYMLTETCCQIDLLKLFHNGFSTGHGYLREPNGIQSYSALGCIAIQANQNEMHGGQSVPNFDYSMAPGVRKTFRKEYFKALAHYIAFCYDMTQENAKALVDAAKEALGAEDLTMSEEAEYGMRLSRWLPRHQQEGGYQPITDAQTLNAHHAAVEVALIETDKATYQAMEALVHNLNTMNSRAGAQVPFSSINYGTDTSPEGRMVIKNLLDATAAGLEGGGQLRPRRSQLRFVPKGYPHLRQAPFPQLQLFGRPLQPPVLPPRGLQHRGILYGLPHPRDGQPLRPQPGGDLRAGKPELYLH